MRKRLGFFLRQSALTAFTLWMFFFVASPAVLAAPAQLLKTPWNFSALFGPSENYQLIDPNALKGYKILRLVYDLRGTCLLGGDASAIIFDQPVNQTWRYISLSSYGNNCKSGEQTVDIPLTHFRGLDTRRPVGTFHARFWNSGPYFVVIKSATLLSASKFGDFGPAPSPTPPPTAAPTSIPTLFPTAVFTPRPTTVITSVPTAFPTMVPTPVPTAVPSIAPTFLPTPVPTQAPTPAPLPKATWSIQSVSSMKETKDRVCNQRSPEFISRWVDKAVALGVNYIAVETPYDSPTCGDAVAYSRLWVRAIHSRGLGVWHRHMPLAFEGIYDSPKSAGKDYLRQIGDYIKANPDLFAEGDIFTPIPEPQNGGIAGITYCAQGICVFPDRGSFNRFLRDAMDVSEAAFASVGLSGKMKLGYYGFDGFVAWGDNNPDWTGILEDATVLKMGNLTIDHYPEAVGDTMKNDLDELEARYPNIPIVIGEWGTISTISDAVTQVKTTMDAAKRTSVVGFNYWHMAFGGNEELLSGDFVEREHYPTVRSYFRPGQ